jgi:hypothetical protein
VGGVIVLASNIIGYTLIVLGNVAIAGGIAISVIDMLRGAAAQGIVGDIKDLITALTKLLAELAKLRPGAQLVVLGIVIFGIGAWVVTAHPL